MRRLALVLALLGAELGAEDVGDRLTKGFANWLEAERTTGAIVLVQNSTLRLAQGFGKSPDAPVELASLSKAITAFCLKHEIERRGATWSDRFATAGFTASYAQIVTQTSGLRRDTTQRKMQRWFGKKGPHRSARIAAEIDQRGGPGGKPGQFSYTNENYALAGLAFEDLSGKPYASCPIIPRAARPSPVAGTFLPWGGWQAPLANYARWHHDQFAASEYSRNPKDFPHVEIAPGLYYGLGAFFRTLSRGNTFWHFGALCFPGRLETGSFAASYFGEWTVVASFDACVSEKAMFALDRAVTEAVFGGNR